MTRAVLLAAALGFVSSGVAGATPSGEPHASPDLAAPNWTTEEREIGMLADQLADGLAAAQQDGLDGVVLLEAEEIGVIAEELLVEGDAELARSLYEEAIALLGPGATR